MIEPRTENRGISLQLSRYQCWFIPIETWIGYIALMGSSVIPSKRTPKSLGLDEVDWLGTCLTAPAIEIHEDVGRGITNRYWRMAEFMQRFGADLEPTFEDLPAEPVDIPNEIQS